MPARPKLELLLLHALPLDGKMWAGQMGLLPGATHAPTLYGLGDNIENWADAVLQMAQSDRLIVVGCSVGGSCAIEVAAAAPDRVAALVLIGTKARHAADPALHACALKILRDDGTEKAWDIFWAPLFSKTVESAIVAGARRMALALPPVDVARGVTAFHSRPSRHEFLTTFAPQVHVVTGAEDTAPGIRTSAAQARSAPNGHLHVVPECGHYVSLERPGYLNALLVNLIRVERLRAK